MEEEKIRNILTLGKKMREAQKQYFKFRVSSALMESRRLEKEFDKENDAMLNQLENGTSAEEKQIELFGEEKK